MYLFTLAILNNIDTVVQNATYAGGGAISKTTAEGKPYSVPYETFQTPVTVGGERYLVTFNVTASPTNDGGGTGNLVHSIEIEKTPAASPASNAKEVSRMYDENVIRTVDTGKEQFANNDGSGYTKGAEESQNKAGIPKTKVDDILQTPKGSRPDPTSYLSTEYIQNHLIKFIEGVTKIVAQAPTGTAGPPSGTFVMPSYIADDLIAQAGGNVSKLEQLLGLPQGSLGNNPVRIDIANPTGLRLPNGNELGANSQWIPGGYTSGGLLEAIIDSPKIGQYIITPIK